MVRVMGLFVRRLVFFLIKIDKVIDFVLFCSEKGKEYSELVYFSSSFSIIKTMMEV